MADQTVTRDWKQSSYDETEDGATAFELFQVVAASPADARNKLEATEKVSIGAVYRNYLGERPRSDLRCRSVKVQAASRTPIGGDGLWNLSCSFDTRQNTTSSRSARQWPVREAGSPPVYLWSRSEQTTEAEKDLDGLVVQNSKSQPYSPAPSVMIPARFLTVRWYVTAINMSQILLYDGCTNSDSWRIAGRWAVSPGQALLHGIDPTQEDTGLYLLEAQFEFRPGGRLWTPFQILDYEQVGETRVKLDGTGAVLGEGEDEVYNSFRFYDARAIGSVWGI